MPTGLDWRFVPERYRLEATGGLMPNWPHGLAGVDGPHAVWRFVEHRREDPLLPPGVGWMQGVAGIAAFLARAARVPEQGRDAVTVPRMETCWRSPGRGPSTPR